MKKVKHIYSGKAKSLYSTDDQNFVIMHFRDDATAFNGEKIAKLENKGKINNHFNMFIMKTLEKEGVPTHFEKILNDRETLVKSLQMIPVECVVRNIAAGNLARRLGLSEGLELTPPVFEFYYKSDVLGDPMINEYHIRTFKWATDADMEIMKQLSFKINDILKPLFLKANLLLVDYKLEFGHLNGNLVLGDEFTPDGCRIWDAKNMEKLDKDRFRRDLGRVTESYMIAAERLGIEM